MEKQFNRGDAVKAKFSDGRGSEVEYQGTFDFYIDIGVPSVLYAVIKITPSGSILVPAVEVQGV